MKAKIILLILSIFFSLIIGEFIVRLHSNTITYFKPPEDGWIKFDDGIGWVLQKNSTGYENSAKVTINKFGSRNTGSVPTKNPKIITLGDSFTLGAEVNDDQTWPAQLEKKIDLSVANFGVDAYGMDQVYLLWKRIEKKTKPEIVILGLIPALFDRPSLPRWVTGQERPQFTLLNKKLMQTKKKLKKVKEGKTYINWNAIFKNWAHIYLLHLPESLEIQYRPPATYNKGVEVSFALLNQMAKEMKGKNIKFYVVILQNNIYPNFINKLDKMGIKHIDCARLYEGIRGDGHPTVAAHSKYAKAIARYLEKDRLHR